MYADYKTTTSKMSQYQRLCHDKQLDVIFDLYTENVFSIGKDTKEYTDSLKILLVQTSLEPM